MEPRSTILLPPDGWERKDSPDYLKPAIEADTIWQMYKETDSANEKLKFAILVESIIIAGLLALIWSLS